MVNISSLLPGERGVLGGNVLGVIWRGARRSALWRCSLCTWAEFVQHVKYHRAEACWHSQEPYTPHHSWCLQLFCVSIHSFFFFFKKNRINICLTIFVALPRRDSSSSRERLAIETSYWLSAHCLVVWPPSFLFGFAVAGVWAGFSASAGGCFWLVFKLHADHQRTGKKRAYPTYYHIQIFHTVKASFSWNETYFS